MAQYSITAPNGKTYQIEGPENAPKELLVAVLHRQFGEGIFQPPAPEKQAGFIAGLKSGAERTIGNVLDTAQAFFDPAGAATANQERSEKLSKDYGYTASLDAVKKAYAKDGVLGAGKEVLSQVPGFVGEQLPTLAKVAAGAKAGAMAGGTLGPAGAFVGGGLGGLLAGATDFVGENLADQREMGASDADLDLTKAGGTALAQGSLSALGSAATVGRTLLGKVLGRSLEGLPKETAERLARESLAKSLVKGGTKGTVISASAEIPTEVGQQMLTFLQSGRDLTSDEALAAYAESAYGGALASPAGAVGGVIDRRAQMEPATQPGPTEAELVKQGALKARADEAAALAAEKQRGIDESNARAQAAALKKMQREGTALLNKEAADQAKADKEAASALQEADNAEQAARREERQQGLEETFGTDFSGQDNYAALIQERATLQQKPQNAETRAVIKNINARLNELDRASITKTAEDKARTVQEAQLVQGSAFATPTPQQMEIREAGVLPPGVAAPVPNTDLSVDDGIGEPVRRTRNPGQMSLPFDKPITGTERYQEALRQPSTFDESGVDPDTPITLADIARAVKPDMDAAPGRVKQFFGLSNMAKLEAKYLGKTPRELFALGPPSKSGVDEIVFGEMTKRLQGESDVPQEPQTAPDSNTGRSGDEDPATAGDVFPDSLQRGAEGPITGQPAGGGLVSSNIIAGNDVGGEPQQPLELTSPQEVQQTAVPTPTPAVGPTTPADLPTTWDDLYGQDDVRFTDLPAPLKQRFKEAVEDGYASAATTDEIAGKFRRDRVAKTVAPKPEPTQDQVAQDRRKVIQERQRAQKEAALAKQAGIEARQTAERQAAEKKAEEERQERAAKKAAADDKRKESARIKRETAAKNAIAESEQMRKEAQAKKPAKKQAPKSSKPRLEQTPERPYARPPQGKTSRESSVWQGTNPNAAHDTVYNEIKDMDTPGLAQWLVDSAPDAAAKHIASKVASRIKELASAGVDIPLEIYSGAERPQNLKETMGQFSISRNRLNKKVTEIGLSLNGPAHVANQDGYPSGMQYETILHEMVHAATMWYTRDTESAKDLVDLANQVVAEVNRQIDLPNRSEFVEAIYRRASNAFMNQDELLAWGLTNKQAQEFLADINLGDKSAWDKLVDWVLDVLGVNRPYHSAMSKLLKISDDLFSMPIDQVIEAASRAGYDLKNVKKNPKATTDTYTSDAIQNAPSTIEQDLSDVRDITGRDGPVRRAEETAAQDLEKTLKQSDKLLRFRVNYADNAASVAQKLDQLYSQGTKDSSGNVSPKMLMRQAADAPRLAQAVLRRGSLKFDPLTKSFIAADVELDTTTSSLEVGTKVNPDMLFDVIKDFAKDKGMSYDDSEQMINETLTGLRLQAFLDHNDEMESMALLAEQKGKKDEAKKLREKLIAVPDNAQALADKSTELNDKYEHIRRYRDIWNAVKNANVEQMVLSGRISREAGDAWKAHAEYVPFDRLPTDDSDTSRQRKMTARGLASFSDIPKLVGSEYRTVDNIVDNSFRVLNWMTSQTVRNKAATAVLDDLSLVGWAERLRGPKEAERLGNAVRVFEDGAPVYYHVPNDLDFAAFESLPIAVAPFINGLQQSTRLLRATVTSMPQFAISQLIQDAQRAVIYSGTNKPMAVMYNTIANFFKFGAQAVRGKVHPMVTYLSDIGVQGAVDYNNINPAEEARIKAGLAKRKLLGSTKLGWITHKLESMATLSDLSARAAVYQQIMEEFGDPVRAATVARELINFKRRGKSAAVAWGVAAIPFFNAYVQGMDNLYRVVSGKDSSSGLPKEQARARFMKTALMATSLGFTYALMMAGDDEYEATEDYVKDRAWVMGGGVKLPMPAEVGVIFKVIPERLVQYYQREGTKDEQKVMTAVGDYLRTSLVNAYTSPNVTPQLIKPVVELMTNYSFFTGREIVPSTMEDIESFLQYGSSTTELARIVGEKFNLSPMKIDHVMSSVFGMLGSTVMQTADAILTERGDRPLYKMPLLSTFSYDPIGGKNTTEFYALAEKIRKTKATAEKLIDNGETENAREYLAKDNNMMLVKADAWMQGKLKMIKAAREQRKLIENKKEDAQFTSADKRMMLDALRRNQQQDLADVREAAKILGAN